MSDVTKAVIIVMMLAVALVIAVEALFKVLVIILPFLIAGAIVTFLYKRN